MSKIALTRAGLPWEPQFITNINQETCIGCGRCYKVCSRNVFDLIEREIDDDDEDDQVMMVMTLANEGDCIGCVSCAKVCPKLCQTHVKASLLA